MYVYCSVCFALEDDAVIDTFFLLTSFRTTLSFSAKLVGIKRDIRVCRVR